MKTLPGIIVANEGGTVKVRLRSGGIISGSIPCSYAYGEQVYAGIDYETMSLASVCLRTCVDEEECPEEILAEVEPLNEEMFHD